MLISIIIITILSILGITAIVCALKKDQIWIGALTIIIIISIIAPIMCSSEYYGNYEERASLEAFYTTNTQNYAYTINMSTNILSEAKFTEGLSNIGIGLAYEGQSQAITQAIVEWRNALNDYNMKLAKYNAGNSNILTSWFFPKTNIQYLTIN